MPDAPPAAPTKITILQGDAARHMSDYDPQLVDIMVTSPPYNLDIDYGSEIDDGQTRADYLTKFSPRWLEPAHRILKDDGHLFLNVGGSPSDPLLPHQLILVALECGFTLQNTIHWVKSITVPDRQGEPMSRGHFKPINSPRFLNDCHEYVFHLTKKGNSPLDRLAPGVAVPFEDKSNIARFTGKDVRCGGNNWFIPYDTIRSRKLQRPHPATFPIELPARCIKLAGCRPVVMDPFVGLGNTLLAARSCGAEWAIGIDLCKEFAHEAGSRLGAKVHYA